jgi:hypothetical protein
VPSVKRLSVKHEHICDSQQEDMTQRDSCPPHHKKPMIGPKGGVEVDDRSIGGFSIAGNFLE